MIDYPGCRKPHKTLFYNKRKQVNMKKYYPVLAVSVIVLLLACSAGCSQKETPSQRESVERPSGTLANPTLNADSTDTTQ